VAYFGATCKGFEINLEEEKIKMKKVDLTVNRQK